MHVAAASFHALQLAHQAQRSAKMAPTPYRVLTDRPRVQSLDGQDDGAEGEQGSSRSSQSSQSSEDQDGQAESSGQGEYEFSQWEERVLEMVMEALRMSGLALLLQAISTTLLGQPRAPSRVSGRRVQLLLVSR